MESQIISLVNFLKNNYKIYLIIQIYNIKKIEIYNFFLDLFINILPKLAFHNKIVLKQLHRSDKSNKILPISYREA